MVFLQKTVEVDDRFSVISENAHAPSYNGFDFLSDELAEIVVSQHMRDFPPAFEPDRVSDTNGYALVIW